MSPDSGKYPQDEPESGSAAPRVAPEPPSAKVQKSRWPGWIWSIPIAAVLIVAYLAFKELAAAGPTVTVIFPQAEGISAGQTEVEYQGMKVGQVTSVKLEKDLHHVRTEIEMNSEMEGHLGPGTLFWIEGPSLSNLASIRSIISGPKIGIQPHEGKKQDQYQGLAEAPPVQETKPGREYILKTTQLGNAQVGSQIYYNGMSVGKVEAVKLLPDRSFELQAFVQSPYDQLIHDGTRFWNAGAVQFSLAAAGPQVQFEGLPSLLNGSLAFETPEGEAQGPQAAEGHVFTLYSSKEAADYSPNPTSVLYRVVFGADAGDLQKYAPVKLAGTQVGTVQSAQLAYDPQTGQLKELATIAIDPTSIGLPGGRTWPKGDRSAMDDFMRKLIGQGLRARAGSTIPMVGPKDVELTFAAGVQSASLIPGSPPEIPTAPGGGGVEGVLTAVNNIANKLNGVPLDQIADNIRTITNRLAQLSQSPKLTQSLDSLNRSLNNVQQITASAKADLPSLLASFRKLAADAQRTVADARQLISTTSGNGPLGMNQAGLGRTLYELTRAAEAVRQLAEYLDRNPSALIRGRG